MSQDLSEAIWFGVTDGEMTPAGGMIVKALDKFGSMAKAGIQIGDEIQYFDGVKFNSLESARSVLYELAAKVGLGGTIRVRLIRAGKKLEIPMKLRGKPKLMLSLDEVENVLERKIAPAIAH